MLERRRASQRQAEASAGETAEEMLERLQDELNTLHLQLRHRKQRLMAQSF